MDNKVARIQEIYRRGLQDKLPPEKRARADEAIRRGLIKVEGQPVATAKEVGGELGAIGEKARRAGFLKKEVEQPKEKTKFVGGIVGGLAKGVQSAIEEKAAGASQLLLQTGLAPLETGLRKVEGGEVLAEMSKGLREKGGKKLFEETQKLREERRQALPEKERKFESIGKGGAEIAQFGFLGSPTILGSGFEGAVESLLTPTKEGKISERALQTGVDSLLNAVTFAGTKVASKALKGVKSVGKGIKKLAGLSTEEFADASGSIRKLASNDDATNMLLKGIDARKTTARKIRPLVNDALLKNKENLSKTIKKSFPKGSSRIELVNFVSEGGLGKLPLSKSSIIKKTLSGMEDTYKIGLEFSPKSKLEGLQLFNEQGLVSKKSFKNFTIPETQGFLEGVRDNLTNIIDSSEEGANIAKKITNIEEVVKKISKGLNENEKIAKQLDLFSDKGNFMPKLNSKELIENIRKEGKIFKNLIFLSKKADKRILEDKGIKEFLGEKLTTGKIGFPVLAGIFGGGGVGLGAAATQMTGKFLLEGSQARAANKLLKATTPKKAGLLAKALSSELGKKVTTKQVSNLASALRLTKNNKTNIRKK